MKPCTGTGADGVAPAEDGDPSRVSRRILLADDEEALVELLTMSLEARGHRVTGHSDPRKALEAFRARPGDFDVLVTDLAMPYLPGLELARLLLAERPGLVVIATSGHASPRELETIRSIGGLGVAPKGYSVEAIANAIEALLRGEPLPDPEDGW